MNGYKSMTDNRFPALSRRGFLLLGGNAAAGLIGAGCGGGGGTAPTGPLAEDDLASIFPTGPELPTVVSAGARLVPEDGSVSVAAIDENRVVLTGNVGAMGLAPGLVVASFLGGGFTRRVVNITSDGGGGTVLETSEATLEDAFDSLEIRALSDLAEAGTRQQGGTALNGGTSLNIRAKIPESTLFSSGAKSVKLSGEVNLGGKMAAAVRLQKLPGGAERPLEFFGFVVDYRINGQLKINGQIAVAPDSVKLQDILTKNLAILGEIANAAKNVPKILQPKFDLKLAFVGGFQPNIAFTTLLGASGRIGFVWTRGRDFSFYGGAPKFDTPSFQIDSALNPYKGVDFLVTVKPKLELLVGGVVGPFLELAAPSVYAKFTRTDDTLFHGMGVSVGANLAGEIGISDRYKLLNLPKRKVFDRELVKYQKFFDDSAKTSLNVR
ncbi:hypothetical protein [Armatimonas sp.]|uniref:hypothetical protein n=1 Tax=Armatimonas sp. TaxID=1872638 RepID=UPI00286CD9EB|nr:hypothetical protein [Armatimonas sp.]